MLVVLLLLSLSLLLLLVGMVFVDDNCDGVIHNSGGDVIQGMPVAILNSLQSLRQHTSRLTIAGVGHKPRKVT
jgi:hypothetical protein